MRFISIFAATLATVAANPLPEAEIERRQAACNANNVAFRVISNLGPRGSIFCNDLLALPTSVIPTTLPTPIRTITVASPSITGACGVTIPVVTKREPEAAPEAEAEPVDELEKRQGLGGLLPGLGLLAGSQITGACSCLSLAPRTITSRITPPVSLSTITNIVPTCTPTLI